VAVHAPSLLLAHFEDPGEPAPAPAPDSVTGSVLVGAPPSPVLLEAQGLCTTAHRHPHHATSQGRTSRTGVHPTQGRQSLCPCVPSTSPQHTTHPAGLNAVYTQAGSERPGKVTLRSAGGSADALGAFLEPPPLLGAGAGVAAGTVGRADTETTSGKATSNRSICTVRGEARQGEARRGELRPGKVRRGEARRW
jgi:hypothetical protein